MSTFSAVLVVTDLSELSNRAIPFAYGMVRDSGTVHLIHLLEHDSNPSPLYSHYAQAKLNVPEEREEALAKVAQDLTRLIPSGAKSRNITTKVGAALHRVISEGIVAEAAARQVDAIVMATHGRTGLGRMMLGSVAQKVMESSGIPVLVVPPARR